MRDPPPAATNQPRSMADAAIFLGLLVVTCAVYLPVLQNGFVNYDDQFYITRNPLVQAGLTREGARWAFTTMAGANWHPLTWLSHMADCQMFGMKAGAHHAVSLLCHALNAGLLYLVLRRMTGAVRRSAVVAALFALHPLHVESVAWAAERKDVLSTFFWLLTMLAYGWHVRRPSWQRYLAVICLLALGLMAKPMLVTLPCALMILDWWPLGRYAGAEDASAWWRRFGRLAVEKIPLFALVAVSSVLTFVAQKGGGATVAQDVLQPGWRLANAVVSYAAYLGKMFWPSGLSVLYPHPGRTPVVEIIVASAVVAMIIAAAVYFRRRSYVLAGCLWYFGTLVPVIGLVQVGTQAMADRYTYVPLIGIFVALVWAGADAAQWALERLGHSAWTRGASTAVAAAALAACGAATVTQVRYWRDTETLFRHAIHATKNNATAHYVLGIALFKKGSLEESAAEYREVLRLKPGNVEARNNLGAVLVNQGKVLEGIDQYRETIRRKPDYAEAHNNLGAALVNQRRLDEAIEHYREAVRLKPGYTDAQKNLQSALQAAGRPAAK